MRRPWATCSLIVAACALLGCGTRPLLPTLTLHALLTLRQAAKDTRQTASHDFGLQARLVFRPRSKPRPLQPRAAQLPIALPQPPDCQYAIACEWAQLAEESALSALGVSP